MNHYKDTRPLFVAFSAWRSFVEERKQNTRKLEERLKSNKLSFYFSHWRARTRERYDVAMEAMIKKMEMKTGELRRKKDLENMKKEEEVDFFKRYFGVFISL